MRTVVRCCPLDPGAPDLSPTPSLQLRRFQPPVHDRCCRHPLLLTIPSHSLLSCHRPAKLVTDGWSSGAHCLALNATLTTALICRSPPSYEDEVATPGVLKPLPSRQSTRSIHPIRAHHGSYQRASHRRRRGHSRFAPLIELSVLAGQGQIACARINALSQFSRIPHYPSASSQRQRQGSSHR